MQKIDIHIHANAADPQLDRYLKLMDEHDVAYALVHAVPETGCDNEDVARAVNAHSDRLFGSVHVDLREDIKKCIELTGRYAEMGFKSVKLFPNLGFDPNDEQYEPFFQVLDDNNLMCLSHCGYLSNGGQWAKRRLTSLLATPLHFEMPARRFPGVNFIFAHFGGGFSYLETVTMISRFENAYADTCPGWGRWVFEQKMPGLKGLNFEHVMYGTDNAGNSYTSEQDEWIETFTELGCTEQDLQNYFYNNAARLLGIE